MKKSVKKRNLELLGLTESTELKSLTNDKFQNLSESYAAENKEEEVTLEGEQQEQDVSVEKFEQKSFESREEDADLYDLMNETFEIEIEDEELKEAFDSFKGQAVDDLEDDLINNYEDITTGQVRKFLREFTTFLDNSDLNKEL